MPSGSARTRAATSSPSIPMPRRGSAGARAAAGTARPHRRPHRRQLDRRSRAKPALPLAELRAAHEAWLPGYMAAVH